MGDHNSGGSGSVSWTIDMDHVPKVTSGPYDGVWRKRGGWRERGDDPDPPLEPGDVKKWFTVSIKVPKQFASPLDYIEALKGNDEWGIKPQPDKSNRVYFNVPIEYEREDEGPSQIRTSWGRSKYGIRPTRKRGGRKRQTSRPAKTANRAR